MESVFSRYTKKRKRTSSTEENYSFVKDVTSRISSLLPASVTKWFSSSSSSNANGSLPTLDVTDSSTEDEIVENSILSSPPPKRMKFSANKYNNFTLPETSCISDTINPVETVVPLPDATVHSSPSIIRRDSDFISIKKSKLVDTNTPKPEIESTVLKSPYTLSTGHSIAVKRKSLFESSKSKVPKSDASKTTSHDNSPDRKSIRFRLGLLGSPFYPSKTVYGGASYVNQPNIKEQRTAYVNIDKSHSDSSTVLSQSAKRVLELLEQYSSPVMEARRIPQYTKPTNNSSCNKLENMNIPNIASILRVKERSRLIKSTTAARQLIASQNSAMASSSNSATSRSLNIEPREEKETEKNRQMMTLEDSKEKRLQLSAPGAGSPVDHNNHQKSPIVDANALHLANSPSSKSNITVNELISSKCKTQRAAVNKKTFNFSIPEVITDNAENYTLLFANKSQESKISNLIDKDTITTASDVVDPSKEHHSTKLNKLCSDSTVLNEVLTNKYATINSEVKLNETPKITAKCMCKLADAQSNGGKCLNCEELNVPKNNNVDRLPTQSLKPAITKKWTCKECWVSNVASVDKCVCCGNINMAADQTKKINNTPECLKSTTNKGDINWKCEDCWISNKASVDKCVACGGVRHSEKSTCVPSSISSPVKLPDNGLKTIINLQKSNKWECTGCLVNNENNRSACVCCGQTKPGVNESVKKSFNFGIDANTFKFGINLANCNVQPNPVESNENTLLQPESKSIPVIDEGERNNNTLHKIPTCTLKLSPTKSKVESDQTTNNNELLTKTNFSFGILKTSPDSKLTKTPEKIIENTQSQNVLDKPQFKIPMEVQKKDNILLTPADSNSLDKQSLGTIFGSDNKQPANTSSTVQTETNKVTSEAPKNNIFNSLVSTSTTTSPTFGSLQNISAILTPQKAASVSAPSIFEKDKMPTISTNAQNFATSASGPTTTSVAPIFGFGLATNNFSFGNPQSNKLMFNSNTSATNSVETPTFSFTTGKTVDKSSTTLSVPGITPSSNNEISTGLGTLPTSISGNNLSSSSTLTGSNEMSSNLMTQFDSIKKGISNTATVTQNTPPTANLFGVNMQKDNIWSPNTTTSSQTFSNLFVSNTSTNSVQPATSFNFGSSMLYNRNTATPSFGSVNNQTNMFGSMQQNSSMFSNPAQNQISAAGFSAPTAASVNHTPPSMSLFGTPNASATPIFGRPFETQSTSSQQLPAFNFGSNRSEGFQEQPQQQPPQQQPLQTGIYNFGGNAVATPQVQFNIGSGVNTTMRRVRKAMRRNPQR